MPVFKFRALGIDIVLVGRGSFGSEAKGIRIREASYLDFCLPDGLRGFS